MKTPKYLLVLSAVLLALSGTGCESMSYVSVPDRDLPVDTAWKKMEEDRKTNKVVDWTLEKVGQRTSFEAEKQRQIDAAKQRMGGQPLDAYNQLVDQSSQYIVRELPLTKEIATAQRKQVLLVGEVVDKSRLHDPRLNAAFRELADRLQKNQTMQKNFVFVGLSTDAADRALKAAGAGKAFEFKDPLEANASAGNTQYDPDSIYVLNGQFFQSTDLDHYKCDYTLGVDIQKATNRQNVKSDSLVKTYYYQPYRQDWISDDQNAALQSKLDAVVKK